MTIALIIIAILIVYIIIQYNVFVKARNSVKEAFSTMDVYLKKRWDLVPNLVEVVKGYTEHENKTFEKITELRNQKYDGMTSLEKINANQQLNGELSKIIAVAENYPELKASQNYLDLSKQLSKIEDEIANSRKYYNAVVKKLNTRIEMFPSNIVAKIFKFKQEEMFTVEENERKNVKIGE